MAFNNGFPINYQQPMFFQPQQSQPQINNNMIWVQGENAAKSYPVAPNTSVPLWDSEAQVIYIKSADMSGMPSMKIIDYTIRDNNVKTTVPEIVDTPNNFATKDDIDKLKKEIENLRDKLNKSNAKEKRNE